MTRAHPSRHHYATRWDGDDLLVLDHEAVIDRIRAREIHRLILVCDGGDAPSDLSFAVIETSTDCVILPAETGIAGRVHFERQAFWQRRPCVYWVAASRAPLPRQMLPGLWLLRRPRPAFARVPLPELAPAIERWPLEGPQSWEQRKWARIVAARSLPGAKTRPPQ